MAAIPFAPFSVATGGSVRDCAGTIIVCLSAGTSIDRNCRGTKLVVIAQGPVIFAISQGPVPFADEQGALHLAVVQKPGLCAVSSGVRSCKC